MRRKNRTVVVPFEGRGKRKELFRAHFALVRIGLEFLRRISILVELRFFFFFSCLFLLFLLSPGRRGT